MFSLKLDLQLTIATCLLLLTGIITHISLSPDRIVNHLIFLSVGFGIFLFTSQLDSKYFPFFWLYYYGLAIILLILPLLLGVNTRGASRWIYLGPLQLQPSEISKILIILSLSKLLTLHPPNQLKNLGLALAFIAFPSLLIFIQPDLGSALILLFISLTILFVAAVRYRVIFALMALVILAAPFGWHTLKPYQKNRIHTFINPQADPLGEGYNTIQSIIAVGSGKFFGKGLGRGSQSQLKFLPEYQTDFVFAAYAEEFGFLGGIILISLFFWLLWRVSHFASHADSNFSYFVFIGVMMMVFSQFAINIGMNLGILPVTGITLPLISAGGSSIISTLLGLGVVSSLSQNQSKPTSIEIT